MSMRKSKTPRSEEQVPMHSESLGPNAVPVLEGSIVGNTTKSKLEATESEVQPIYPHSADTVDHGRKILFLQVAYCLGILASYTCSALTPAMKTELGFHNSAVMTLASILALSSAFAQIVSTMLVTLFGANRSLFLMLACEGCICLALSTTYSFFVVASLSVLLQTAICILWPATVCIIQSITTTGKQRSTALWGVAIASRLGAFLSGPFFGGLNYEVGWRHAAVITTIPCVVGAAVISIIPSAQSQPATATAAASADVGLAAKTAAVWQTIKGFSQMPPFWCCVGASSLFTGLKVFDQSMVALYLIANAEPGLVSDSLAILLAPSFTVGVVIAVLCFGGLFTRCSPKERVFLVDSLNAVALLATVGIFLDSFSTATTLTHVYIRCVGFSLIGFGLGISFYQPIGLFAMRAGGEKSGLLAGVVDAFSYLWAFLFLQGIVYAMKPHTHWSKVWGVSTIAYMLAALMTHMYVESIADEDEQS